MLAGTLLPLVPVWPSVCYFIGLCVALLGGFLFTRGFDYQLCGIGFALPGAPLFMFAMLPGSLHFLASLEVDPAAALVARLSACLCAIFCYFAAFTACRFSSN